MNAKDIIIILGNVAIVATVLYLGASGKMPWPYVAAIIGGTAFPSAGSVVNSQMRLRRMRKLDASRISPVAVFVLILTGTAIGVGTAALLSGCAAVGPACAVIQVADDACVTLAIPLADGGIQTVKVPPQELKSFAETQQVKAARDGGLLK